ncbi:MAG: ketoacyl-ACP synthase III [Myxococcota bacterium]
MRIVGISAAVPKNVAKTRDAAKHFPEHDVSRIVRNTGVEEKREAAPGQTVSKMCVAAAEDLLEAIGWERETVDAVVLVTSMGDYVIPSTAHVVQAELGLPDRCLAFDINLSCSGYTHGLVVLEGLLKSGVVKRALLLCGEMTAGCFRPRIADCRHRSDLANSILFGDCGTATALTVDGESQIVARDFGADGTGFDRIIVPGGAGAIPWGPEMLERKMCDDEFERLPTDLVLQGPEVLTFTMKRVPQLMKSLLATSGWTTDDIDVLVPHQANKFMLDFLARRMKVPAEKVLFSIREFGNTAAGSIPLTIVVSGEEHWSKPTKWAFMGFGVGLSWSGLLLETDKLIVPPLRELE